MFIRYKYDRVLSYFFSPLPLTSGFLCLPFLIYFAVTTANLETVEALARVAMDNEIIAREQDMKTLATLTEEKQAREAVLDKKRKFLDDVPIRLAKMQTTFLDDLHKQFETYRKGLFVYLLLSLSLFIPNPNLIHMGNVLLQNCWD